MAGRDYYVILGVPRDASPAGIRAAFRELAKRTHPDRVGPGGASRFAEVREAYETLSDAERRRAYDAALGGGEGREGARRGSPSGRGPGAGMRWRPRASPARGPGASPGGGPGASPAAEDRPWGGDRARPGAETLSCQVVLSPAEAARGGVLPMQVPVALPCPDCAGRGAGGWGLPCPGCLGLGAVEASLPVRLPIPAGVGTGAHLELSLGSHGLPGVVLRARIRVREEPFPFAP